MRHSLGIRLTVAVATVLALIAVGNAASAVWRVTGAGNGTGATGVAVAATLSPGDVAANLYPGGSAAVSTTASNPNAGLVRIRSLALDTSQGTNGFAVDAAHAGCPTTSFGFATQTNSGLGWNLPGNGSLDISLPGAVSMLPTAVNACQGVIVTVFLRAGS